LVHDTVHTGLASTVSSSMSGTEFLENFKSCITKAVCITHLNLLLRLMSEAIPILCLHSVQWGTSTYSQIVSWLNCHSNTFCVSS